MMYSRYHCQRFNNYITREVQKERDAVTLHVKTIARILDNILHMAARN